MRLTLADAGDSIEDANFDEKNAEAQLLRLYNFLEWSKEVLENSSADKENSFDSENLTYFDRIFKNEINRLIQLTEQAYEQMLYKDVVKYGFFQLQNIRDIYQEICSKTQPINTSLIKHFILVQILVLSPICPHICEHIYQKIYPNQSIMNAKWPVHGKFERKFSFYLFIRIVFLDKIDQSLSDSFEYFQNTIKMFRGRFEKYSNQQRTNANENRQATIYIATNYPQWQSVVIEELKKQFQKDSTFPENNVLYPIFKDHPQIDKKYLKKLMPFVTFCKELVADNHNNIQILNEHLTFDEFKIINDNQDYLKKIFKLNEIHIKEVTDDNRDQFEDITPGLILTNIFYSKHIFFFI